LTEAPAGADGARVAFAPGRDPLARAVFALLVVACFAAFLITQRLKHTPTAVHSFMLAYAFSPYPGSATQLEAIAFKLANSEAVSVTILDSRGDTVATLVRDYPLKRYKELSLRWNGHRGSARRFSHLLTPDGRSILVPDTEGALAPPGEYRVGVRLYDRSQQVLLPRSFALVKP
jgi:hypothetical protein